MTEREVFRNPSGSISGVGGGAGGGVGGLQKLQMPFFPFTSQTTNSKKQKKILLPNVLLEISLYLQDRNSQSRKI